MAAGNVIIHPFNKRNLSNCSFDVRLGPWYYRHKNVMPLFNPWIESDVKDYWGLPKHEPHGIILQPGETVLAHTIEFIGGRGTITTMMKCRSSLGRANIGVCKCAGWGDVGYVNRWTMEISNFSTNTAVLLPVGARIAQIVFLTTGITSKQYNSKYQDLPDLETEEPEKLIERLKEAWKPDSMLPKLWLDFNK